jgi:hypothetical protein
MGIKSSAVSVAHYGGVSPFLRQQLPFQPVGLGTVLEITSLSTVERLVKIALSKSKSIISATVGEATLTIAALICAAATLVAMSILRRRDAAEGFAIARNDGRIIPQRETDGRFARP